MNMNALAVALKCTISKIAIDWGWQPCRVAWAMCDLARGAPEHGIGGFIRPQLFTDHPRLLGYWTM